MKKNTLNDLLWTLMSLSKEELVNIGKKIGITGHFNDREDLEDEIYDQLNAMEILGELTATVDTVNKLLKVEKVEDLAEDKEQKTVKVEEIIKSFKTEHNSIIEQSDFNSALPEDLVEDSKTATDIVTKDLVHSMNEIYSLLRKQREKKQYSWNTEPITILKDAIANTSFEDRLIDIAFYMTYGNLESIDDVRTQGQYSETQIINNYNEEQNAKRDMIVMQSMSKKPASEKQMNALTTVINRIMDNKNVQNKEKVLEELQSTLENINVTAWEAKKAIEKGYEALNNCPITEKQASLMSQMKRLGIRPSREVKTYQEASNYIKNAMSLFNEKQLVRECKLIDNKFEKEEVKKYTDEEIRRYNYSIKRNRFLISQLSRLTGKSLFESCDVIDKLNNRQQLILAEACMSKDMENISNCLRDLQ